MTEITNPTEREEREREKANSLTTKEKFAYILKFKANG